MDGGPADKKGFEPKILDLLAESEIVKPGALVILESSLDTSPDYVDEKVYEMIRIKEYKNNQHVFLRAR